MLHGGSAWTSDRNVEAPATDAFVWKPNVSYRESIAVDDLRGRILDETLFSLPVPPHPKEIKHNDQVLNSRYWESPKGSTVILSDESGTPLLSYWKVGENYVYHINIELPAKQLAPVGLTVVDRLIDLVGLSSYALLMPNWELNRHPVAGGHVVVSWNRSMVEGRSVSPEHKGRRYNREKLPESETMRLVGASQRLYRIYSVFEDREWDVASKADGTIEIELSYSPDIIYYGEPSDEFMETIAEAKSAALKR